MADSKDRISAAATDDQPNPAMEKVQASDADVALAAMGYKPVSYTHTPSTRDARMQSLDPVMHQD